MVRTSLARLEQLDVGDQALYFGRIDRLPEPGVESTSDNPLLGESFHIGRLAVSGPDHEPLVVDWRAPVAEPFYRATGLDPQGLARRRHLAVRGRAILGLEDEYFVDPEGRTGASAPAGAGGAQIRDGGERLLADGLVLGGPGALLSALGQARTGQMGDIIGTIQREQDEIIRSPLPGVLVVQGGPGTGKTAVALHRAAYLLYTHRFPLERQGVLVVGPNPLFLRYIEQVLPSLGETGVSLSTVAGLVPEVRVRGVDDPAVAKLKGDVRMVKVLTRAVRTRQRPLRRDVEVPFGAGVLRLRAKFTEDVVGMARRRPGTHNARRRFVEAQVLRALSDEYRARLERSGLDAADGLDGEDEAPTADEQKDLAQRLRRVPEVVDALDRMWPRLSAHEFLHDLLGARALLTAAGKGILSATDMQRLYRPRSTSLDTVQWTVGDAALIDEARTLLGPRRGRPTRTRAKRAEEGMASEMGFWPQGLAASPEPISTTVTAAEDEVRAFGHIVVDEVQDLSPMQLRMLARRSLSGSMTVVGDIAQATGPWAPAGWDDITRHLTPQRPPRLVELTVSYRTPAEVVALAAQVLAVAAPEISPPRPVRESGFPPRIVATSRLGPGRDAGPTGPRRGGGRGARPGGRSRPGGDAAGADAVARRGRPRPHRPQGPLGRRPGGGPGGPAGRRDERSGVRFGHRRGALADCGGRRRCRRRRAAGTDHTGLADPLRRFHETDPAAHRAARRAAPRRVALTWAFGPPPGAGIPAPPSWRRRARVD